MEASCNMMQLRETDVWYPRGNCIRFWKLIPPYRMSYLTLFVHRLFSKDAWTIISLRYQLEVRLCDRQRSRPVLRLRVVISYKRQRALYDKQFKFWLSFMKCVWFMLVTARISFCSADFGADHQHRVFERLWVFFPFFDAQTDRHRFPLIVYFLCLVEKSTGI